MLKTMVALWWTVGLIIFSLVAISGGTMAWVGIIMCALLLVLSIFDWGNSKDPNDWSV
jgi:hypothetical protein